MFTVGDDDQDERLDTFLADRDEVPISRSQIRKAIDRGEIVVGGLPASKAGLRLRTGDTIECRITNPDRPDLNPEDIPLDILHEDGDVLVLTKPAGMVVHPAPGHPNGTLVNALLHHCQALSSPLPFGQQGHLRPGIVHRLDRDTSGVMVVARSDQAMRSLGAQFAAHSIDRQYLGLVANARRLDDAGTFSTGHGRHPGDRRRFIGQGPRSAVTHFKVVERFTSGAALVACRLEPGRTHPIRVHLSEAGAPILADDMYGSALSQTRHIDRQALHAELLGFDLPDGRRLRFEAPPPPDFQHALDVLRSGQPL